MKKPIKFCKNPDCGDEIIEYKSSKREYCGDYCRNHHGHKRRSEENLEFNLSRKGMLENYKLLKLFRDSDILIEDLDKFEKLGFNTKCLPETKFYKVGGVNTKCYEFKDIVFGLDPKDETKIIIYKKNEKK
jgi:hypothetical protein